MAENYHVYNFSGLGGFVNGKWTEKKIRSLLTLLTDTKHYSIPKDTKGLFEDRRLLFSCKEETVKSISKDVTDGVAIFPINSTTSTDEVVHYLTLGLRVKFMKDREFKRFKKEYTLNA